MSDENDVVMGMLAAHIGLALSNGAIALQPSMRSPEFDAFVRGFDLVIAFYSDGSGGIGCLPIAGWDVYKQAVANGGDRDIRSNALPCTDRKAALELLSRFGNPEWANEFRVANQATYS